MEDVCHGDKELPHGTLATLRVEETAGVVLTKTFGVGDQEDSQVGQYAGQVPHKDVVVLGTGRHQSLTG